MKKEVKISEASVTDSDSSLNLSSNQYYELRNNALNKYEKEGFELYPHKFHVTISIPDFIKKFSYLSDGEHLESVFVTLAGRLIRIAESGSNLKFYDIYGEGEKIQIIASKNYYKPVDPFSSCDDFCKAHSIFRRGDIIGISGFPGKSKKGELSVFSHSVKLLSPCLHNLPTTLNVLKDQETRYRQRYLDLMLNKNVKDVFILRSKIIHHIRTFLEDKDFIEVETPMMSLTSGGASAQPFITHHNDLNLNLYLRIAPELFLKTLVIGGLDRVFEIGKNFRNEGIDLNHNPEFTACEFYMAYADYHDITIMTEEIISSMVFKLFNSYKVNVTVYEHNNKDTTSNTVVELDFTPPYPKLSFVDEIEKRSGVKLPRPLSSSECISSMKSILISHNVELPWPHTASKLLDKLCSFFLEKKITSPTFICDHPLIMSPLAKAHRNIPEMAERCELFILGQEIANFYTESNDPRAQREAFSKQSKDKEQGDVEAHGSDENYCTALDHALPPTGGCGIGIDRLVMLLADKCNIKVCFNESL